MKHTGLLLISFLIILGAAPSVLAGVPVNSPAPDFTLNDVNGVPHSLSDFEGKVVVLNFWQST